MKKEDLIGKKVKGFKFESIIGVVFYADDMDEYILIDGEYILDDPEQIRAYVLQHAVILDTMQIWEDGQRGVL